MQKTHAKPGQLGVPSSHYTHLNSSILLHPMHFWKPRCGPIHHSLDGLSAGKKQRSKVRCLLPMLRTPKACNQASLQASCPLRTRTCTSSIFLVRYMLIISFLSSVLGRMCLAEYSLSPAMVTRITHLSGVSLIPARITFQGSPRITFTQTRNDRKGHSPKRSWAASKIQVEK